MNGLGDIRLYEAIGAMRDKADELEAERDQLADENAKLRELVVLGIMLPLNEEQMDLLDKTFVSEFGEGLYVQLEKLGIEATK